MPNPLTPAELSVMQLLWQDGRMSAREILDRLYAGERTSQHGTVQKLLQRLEDKAFVKRDRTMSVQYFEPRVSQRSYLTAELSSLADQLTEGKLAPLVTALLEGNKFSKAELANLRRIVEER